MTLTVRNRFFIGGMILAGISLAGVSAAAFFTLSSFPPLVEGAAQSSGGFFRIHLPRMLQGPSLYIPYWTILASAIYSALGISLCYLFFEKTQAPEIIFIGFFILSFSFELNRLIMPLRELYPLPAVYLLWTPRLLLFGRYFGLFSLFAASIYSAGFDIQTQLNVFFVSILASLVIILNVPIDILSWDTSLVFIKSYNTMLTMIEGGIICVTGITFFISAYIQSSRYYLFIGLGSLLMALGRNILLHGDTWIFIPGIILLALGTYLACVQLHRIYLWR